MNEVANAISEISESSQQTSFESGTVMENMGEAVKSVQIITELTHKQKEIVDTLDSVVNRFTLK
jgi:methyl-accepting chemotaxis protein